MQTVLIASSILLWIVTLFCLVLTLGLVRRMNAFVRANQGLSINQDMVGKKAPDFEAETVAGKTVSLSDYAKQKTALVVVSPECSPCREKLPEISDLHPYAKKSGVELVLVSLGNSADTQKMVQEFNIQCPVIVAPRPGNTFSEAYRIAGTPSYYLIDSKSNIQHVGFLDNEWADLIQEWRGDKVAIAS